MMMCPIQQAAATLKESDTAVYFGIGLKSDSNSPHASSQNVAK